MIPDHAELVVRIYDGKRPVAREGRLRLISGRLELTSPSGRVKQISLNEVRVSERLGNDAHFIDLPDGRQLECPHQPWLAALRSPGQEARLAARLEQRWWSLLTAAVCIALGLLAFFVYGFEPVMRHAARAISAETERQWGDRVLSFLSEKLAPSTLQPSMQAAVEARFEELRRAAGLNASCMLQIRSSEEIGENAFTLPGCIVVITDQLVRRLESDEVAAVLAHELGHAKYRHALIGTVTQSTLATLVGLTLGDAASIDTNARSASELITNTYSRAAEREADSFGVELLKKIHVSPESFARVFIKLEGERPQLWSLFSTHPTYQERVERARTPHAD